MIITILSSLVLFFFIFLAGTTIIPVFFGAPWHPLSDENINKIIKFAGLKPGEKFYDLGSGDGRVLIAASKKRFVTGVGVEIDPIKVWLSRYFATTEKLSDKIRIHHGNMFNFDVREADVIYLYLTHQALDRLFPEILDQMKPSARIICYRFCIRNLEPTKINKDQNLFLYSLNKGTTLNAYS